MNIILASSSSYRRQLLARLGISFTCQNPDIDETPSPSETPEQLAARLSQEKAAAIAHKSPDSLIIASDQVAVLNNSILHKPVSADRAFRQLKTASGQTVSFLTGLCLHSPSGDIHTEVIRYRVQFRQLTDREIHRYIEKDQPLDCAGSFKWEQLGISLFEKMEGEDPTALEGLPLIRLSALLRKHGLTVP